MGNNVPASRIRRRCTARTFSVCDRVSVNYRGRGRYYAGRVTRRDGRGCGAHYNINYDDGDRENCVDPRNLRSARGGRCVVRGRRCTTGFSVSANWRGYGRYYGGRVTGCTSGMYTIVYSDGDREANVPASRIRSCSGCPSTRYRNGQTVYGNYRGEGYWYPGRVTGGNARAGYVVRLSDGDMMRATTTCNLRARAWRVNSMTIGTRARVRHRGGSRCYPAMICGAGTRRGTYKVCYNDGDKENNVASRLIFAGSRM